jgi:hypothetical protein
MTAGRHARLGAACLLGASRTGGPALAAGQDGPGESRKVAGVVDAMDGGKSATVPLDLVNAGGTEI